jgi:hypothetical protein
MSGYTIQVKHSDFPDGEEFGITNLPVQLINGKTAEVTADQADEFKARTGVTVLEALKDNPHFKVKASTAKGGGES